jgi:hypothetical protein
MTQQLEQELSALFHDAATRVEIRPVPRRSLRRTGVNRVLATGLAAALAAGVVLVATRLGSEAGHRGGAVTPAATQQLVDSVARTLAVPLRIDEVTKAQINGAGVGADSGPDDSVIELDVNRHELRITRGGQPSYLLVDKHLYVAIPDIERQAIDNPHVRWQEAPMPADAEDALFGAGTFGLYVLQKTLESGHAAVESLGGRRYHVTLDASAIATGNQPGQVSTVDEVVHLSRDGYVSFVRASFEVTAGTPATMTETARIRPLDHELRLHRPDPATVMGVGAITPGQAVQATPVPCSPTPAPDDTGAGDSTDVSCSMVGARIVGTAPAKAHKRH